MIAIDPNEEFDYVLREDRELENDDPNRIVWKLRPITRRERNKLDNMAHVSAAGTANPLLGDRVESVLRAGIVGCDPEPRDRHGATIPFRKSAKLLNVLGRQCSPVSDEFLDRIPQAALRELADAIEAGARLTDDEGKDS